MLSKKAKLLVICGIVLLAILTRVVCFVGLIGSDDLTYNRQAYAIKTGSFTPQPNHQATRVGLFLPVAGMFALFGVHEVSSVTFPFLCGLVSLGLLIWVGMTYIGWWAGLMAGLLYAFLPIDIFQATQLLPDLPAATYVAVSAILFYQADSRLDIPKGPHRNLWGKMLLAGGLLGWAYLIKETSVFFVVFLAGYMGYQGWRRKRFPGVWGWLGLGLCIPIGLEWGYYVWTTGTPFFRYVAVQAGHNASIFSGHHFQGMLLARRLSLDMFRVLYRGTDFSILHFFAFAGSIYSFWKGTQLIRFCVGWFLTLVFLYNFASTSFSGYAPLLLFHRFFLVLSIPAIVICSWFFQELAPMMWEAGTQHKRVLHLAFAIPYLLMLTVNIVWFSWLTTCFLALIAVLLLPVFSSLVRDWARTRYAVKTLHYVWAVCFLAITISPGIVLAARGERSRTGLTCERDIRRILAYPLQRTVYTDSRTEAILEYFYQYQVNEQIVAFDDVDLARLSQAYVLVNWERLFFLNRLYGIPIPDVLYHPPTSWNRIVQLGGDVNPCVIYEIP